MTLIPRCEKALLHLRALDIGNDDSIMRFQGGSKRGYLPFLEVLAVGIVLDTVYHEIGQVAVFMCYHIYKTL